MFLASSRASCCLPGEIDSGHVEGEFQGDPSFESDVRIEFILEIGPLGVDQAVFFVGKLVFF